MSFTLVLQHSHSYTRTTSPSRAHQSAPAHLVCLEVRRERLDQDLNMHSATLTRERRRQSPVAFEDLRHARLSSRTLEHTQSKATRLHQCLHNLPHKRTTLH